MSKDDPKRAQKQPKATSAGTGNAKTVEDATGEDKARSDDDTQADDSVSTSTQRTARRRAVRESRSAKKTGARTPARPKPSKGANDPAPEGEAGSKIEVRASAAPAQDAETSIDSASYGTANATNREDAPDPADGLSPSPMNSDHRRFRRRRVVLALYNLPAQSQATIELMEPSRWSLNTEGLVGLRVESLDDASLSVAQLNITSSMVTLVGGADDASLSIKIFIEGPAHLARGQVTLPTGAWLALQSDEDQTQVLNHSSWALFLGD